MTLRATSGKKLTKESRHVTWRLSWHPHLQSGKKHSQTYPLWWKNSYLFHRKSNEVHMGHIGKETNSKGKLPLQNKLQKSGITCAGREKSNHIWQQIKQQICRCAHREIYTVSIYCLLLACLSNWKTVRLELFQFKTSPIPSRTKPLHTRKKHHPT